MSMIDVFRSLGRSDALKLREEAATLSETEIVDREHSAPAFDPTKDYSGWRAGSPVRDEGQVWVLLIPHIAAHYTGRPSTLRAMWGLAHTKDPAKAKPYVAPYGTSGLYMTDECCEVEGVVYRSTKDDNPYSPAEYAEWWEKISE